MRKWFRYLLLIPISLVLLAIIDRYVPKGWWTWPILFLAGGLAGIALNWSQATKELGEIFRGELWRKEPEGAATEKAIWGPVYAAAGAFSKPESEQYSREFLLDMQQKWRDITAALSKIVAAMFLSVVVFELLTRAAIGRISLGPFEVTDLSLIYKALPVVIAYFYNDAVTLMSEFAALRDVYATIMALRYKAIYRSGLHLALSPRAPSIMFPVPFTVERRYRTFRDMGAAIGMLIVNVPVLYEIRAYHIQFARFHASDLTIWISLLFTLLLVGHGLTTVGLFGNVMEVPQRKEASQTAATEESSEK